MGSIEEMDPLPRFYKNVLRIDPELVCIVVSRLQDHVEISFQAAISLGYYFLGELAIKLLITLLEKLDVKRFVFIVNGHGHNSIVIVIGESPRQGHWDLDFNNKVLLLEILVVLRPRGIGSIHSSDCAHEP